MPYCRVDVIAPPLQSTQSDILNNPTELIKIMKATGAFLGGNGYWSAFLNGLPHVNLLDPDTYHFMVTPNSSDPTLGLHYLTWDYVDSLGKFLFHIFGKDPQVIAGYNIGYPQQAKSWLSHAMNWGTLHIHCEHHSPCMTSLNNLPPTSHEVGRRHLSDIMYHFWEVYCEENNFPVGDRFVGDLATGTSLGISYPWLEVKSDFLAVLMSMVDQAAFYIHRKLWSIFVSNYDDVRQSGWTLAYNLRLHEEVLVELNKLKSSGFEGNIGYLSSKGVYAGLVRGLDPQATEENHNKGLRSRIHRAPTYSVCYRLLGDRLVVQVFPHITRRRGGFLEGMGILPVRLQVDSDHVREAYACYVERTRAKFDNFIGDLDDWGAVS